MSSSDHLILNGSSRSLAHAGHTAGHTSTTAAAPPGMYHHHRHHPEHGGAANGVGGMAEGKVDDGTRWTAWFRERMPEFLVANVVNFVMLRGKEEQPIWRS